MPSRWSKSTRSLVTFGIPPTYPATGYGYIQRGPEVAQRQGISVFRVLSFREKPGADLAEEWVVSGQYFWNSGIFFWKVHTILEALKANQPLLAAAVERIAAAWKSDRRDEVLKKEYETLIAHQHRLCGHGTGPGCPRGAGSVPLG